MEQFQKAPLPEARGSSPASPLVSVSTAAEYSAPLLSTIRGNQADHWFDYLHPYVDQPFIVRGT